MILRTPVTALPVRWTLLALVALTVGGMLLTIWSGPAVAATTFTVNEVGDAPDTNTADNVCDSVAAAGEQCTLRAAVVQANATAGDDTIRFDPSLTASGDATIGLLTVGLQDSTFGRTALPVSSRVSIEGPTGENGITIARATGAPTMRLFTVIGGSGGNLTLDNLTLKNGVGNIGGAIHNNAGTITISDTTLTDNTASVAGGVIHNNTGTTTISGSTLSGNTGTNSGGGIYNFSGTLTVSNSTLTHNLSQTGGGVLNDGGTTTLTNTTVSHNSASTHGGGVDNFRGTVDLGGTIVASNTSPQNPDTRGIISTTRGFNLLGGDPKLGPLADNGGPTATRALHSDSPAIDGGKAFGSTTDGRGSPRPHDNPAIPNAAGGDGSDIGAVEMPQPPELSVADVRLSEGTGTAAEAVFTVRLSGPYDLPSTVLYATANDTATDPEDYEARSGTLTLEAGQTTAEIRVPVVADALDEPTESLFLNLSGARNATVVTADALATITDDDAAPTLSIADATVVEGDAGTTNAQLVVGLSAASGRTVSVDYATEDGTANAPSDYAEASGTLYFSPGTTSKTINVPVNGDATEETDEAFEVVLSLVRNASPTDERGRVGVTDDDDAPAISIADAPAVLEGDSGSTDAAFAVTLSNPSSLPITVAFSDGAAGSATPGSDYGDASGTLSFDPGATSGTVEVPIEGDTADEDAEDFLVLLSDATNATIADDTGRGFITDDDETPNAAPAANDDSYTTPEGQTLRVGAPGVLANDTDADGDTLTPALETDPAHGDAILRADGSLAYFPAPGYAGPDSFTYELSDGNGGREVATVRITVQDTTPPRISAVTPQSRPKPPRATDVTATFSESMIEASVEAAGTAVLRKKGMPAPIAATVTYEAGTQTVTLDPNGNLKSGATYTATVTTGAKDVAGNALAAPRSWTFTVR
jgi:hypothetical protein